MEIVHIAAECYPVAKAGGLGDVVGALPKYQGELGHIAKVVMPMYKTKFLNTHSFDVVHKGGFNMGAAGFINYTVIKERVNTLGFDLIKSVHIFFITVLSKKKPISWVSTFI